MRHAQGERNAVRQPCWGAEAFAQAGLVLLGNCPVTRCHRSSSLIGLSGVARIEAARAGSRDSVGISLYDTPIITGDMRGDRIAAGCRSTSIRQCRNRFWGRNVSRGICCSALHLVDDFGGRSGPSQPQHRLPARQGRRQIHARSSHKDCALKACIARSRASAPQARAVSDQTWPTVFSAGAPILPVADAIDRIMVQESQEAPSWTLLLGTGPRPIRL